MPFHSTTLPNGLTIIGETAPSARSVALGFFVRTGSRDETPEVSGVTHFLEHMIFKGTERRSALEVNRDFDRIGADSNAYTSEENTVFHAAFLPEYLPKAVDILADILRPSLRPEDFDMEKKVIIEEIGMYEDQPGFAAYDHAKRVHFADHKLGNSILGTVASITDLKRDQMHEYFQRRYVAPNITVAAAGNFDWRQFVALVEQHCGSWTGPPANRDCLREAPGSRPPRSDDAREGDAGARRPDLARPGRRFAAALRGRPAGDGRRRRQRQPALLDAGGPRPRGVGRLQLPRVRRRSAFYASFTGEPESTADNLALVREVLGTVQREGITEEELHQARSKVLSRLVRGRGAAQGPADGRRQHLDLPAPTAR